MFVVLTNVLHQTNILLIFQLTLQCHNSNKTLNTFQHSPDTTPLSLSLLKHLEISRLCSTLDMNITRRELRTLRQCREQFYWSAGNLADPMLLSSYLRVPSCLSGISTLEIWEQFYTNFLPVIIRLLLLGSPAAQARSQHRILNIHLTKINNTVLVLNGRIYRNPELLPIRN